LHQEFVEAKSDKLLAVIMAEGGGIMETVTLPAWLFFVLLALALWALLQLLLVPGVRWYLRRKVNRVIREIGVRMNIDLPQFKLTRRGVLIDRLFHDPRVQAAVERECREMRQAVTAGARRRKNQKNVAGAKRLS